MVIDNEFELGQVVYQVHYEPFRGSELRLEQFRYAVRPYKVSQIVVSKRGVSYKVRALDVDTIFSLPTKKLFKTEQEALAWTELEESKKLLLNTNSYWRR